MKMARAISLESEATQPFCNGEKRMANPRQAERDSNDSVHETTRRTADQASQTSRAMSDTAERTARAGTEAFRRNAETMNSTWRNSSEAATRIAERSVDQFSKLFGLSGDTARETMRQSAGNVAGSARELDLRGRRPAECLRRMDAFRAEPHRGESRAFRGVPRCRSNRCVYRRLAAAAARHP